METSSLLVLVLFSGLLLPWGCQKDYENNCNGEYYYGDLRNPTFDEMKHFQNSGCTIIIGDVKFFKMDYLENLHFMTNITEIRGEIAIDKNTNLTSLSGLNNLLTIDGSIHISNNTKITSFEGLNNLRKITGSLWISGNLELASFEGLNNLQKIGGSLGISDNNKILNMVGLNNLDTIDCLSISNARRLTNFYGLISLNYVKSLHIFYSNIINFEGLPAQQTIDGDIWISNCHKLNSIESLSSTQLVRGLVIIRHNASLSNLSGLRNLHYIADYLGIYDNYFSNLEGLDNLTYVNSFIQILDNRNLTNINALDNVKHVGGYLKIYNNHALYDLCGIKNLLTIGGVSDTVSIYQNLFNPTVEDIIAGNCSE